MLKTFLVLKKKKLFLPRECLFLLNKSHKVANKIKTKYANAGYLKKKKIKNLNTQIIIKRIVSTNKI